MSRFSTRGLKEYDRSGFYWALVYKRTHIVRIYPRGRDAQQKCNLNNTQWKKNGWTEDWSVKRYMFRFRGKEIDAYEHDWERVEKRPHAAR